MLQCASIHRLTK